MQKPSNKNQLAATGKQKAIKLLDNYSIYQYFIKVKPDIKRTMSRQFYVIALDCNRTLLYMDEFMPMYFESAYFGHIMIPAIRNNACFIYLLESSLDKDCLTFKDISIINKYFSLSESLSYFTDFDFLLINSQTYFSASEYNIKK